jgi:hypothetical protein
LPDRRDEMLVDVCLADSPKIRENLFQTPSPPSFTPFVRSTYVQAKLLFCWKLYVSSGANFSAEFTVSFEDTFNVNMTVV